MDSQSMPRFTRMLQSAYEARGHAVTVWSPDDWFYRRFKGTRLAKWAGYIDQYWLFPRSVRRRLPLTPDDTLFVFCDQALGPWVPLVRDRLHVVHAHDLLALRSALGDLPENPTRFTGRVYQRYIRRGFQQARHFISVSKKTREDLHRFGQIEAVTSEVVYNGLNFPYEPLPRNTAIERLRAAGLPDLPEGFLLHVGGSQWYKNQRGVIALYRHYVAQESNPLSLWCVSPEPDAATAAAVARVPARGQVRFLQGIDNPTLQAAYSQARALLFPSLAEGFGWPLIEAQACGCPVLTTDEAPMNEVAGDAALYLPRLRFSDNLEDWASQGAGLLRGLLAELGETRDRRAERGRSWVRQFDGERAIDAYLKIYSLVIECSGRRYTQTNDSSELRTDNE